MRLTPDSLAAAAQRAKEREARARRPAAPAISGPCPRCGEKNTMPTGDGNALGLCGHVWILRRQP